MSKGFKKTKLITNGSTVGPLTCILLPIHSPYTAKILNGEKTIEVRKHAIPVGTKVYIYCTKDKDLFRYNKNEYYYAQMQGLIPTNPIKLNGKVVASFVVSKCEEIKLERINDYSYNTYNYMTETLEEDDLLKKSCLDTFELSEYLQYAKNGYAWYISQLKIFDKPKELKEFRRYNGWLFAKCKKKEMGRCNFGISEYTGKRCGCEKAIITKAPQSYIYVEPLQVD